jgi:hypothetical protein
MFGFISDPSPNAGATCFKEVAREVGHITEPKSFSETMFGNDDIDLAARATGK